MTRATSLRPLAFVFFLALQGCTGAPIPAQHPDTQPQSHPASKPQSQRQSQRQSQPQLLRRASGLQYVILKAGKDNSTRPKFGDRVRVHFTVGLEDGTEVESTRGGAPIMQTVGVQMLPGLAEGLTLVSEGGRIKLVVPPELGFGDAGGPRTGPGLEPVPPKATLVYEVELFDVEPAKQAVPRFTRVPAEQEKPLEDGLRYSKLTSGKGRKPESSEILELRWALFNGHGQLVECTEMPGYRNLKLKQGEGLAKKLKFLRQALAMLKVGDRYRFHVPAKLCYGADARGPLLPPNSDTIWELELVGAVTPLPVPPFARSPLEKTTRTASGLRYEVIKKGDGKSPGRSDRVEVHYAGWLTTGKLFDASYSQGETVTFLLNRVIKGWTEGLQLMKVGGVYKFTVPGTLAYGIRGRRAAGIGPNETLIFHVQLIRILPPDEKDK